MNSNRLGTGATIAALAAIVLLVVMFLNWFQLNGLSAEGSFGDLGDQSIEFSGEDLEAAAESAGEDTSANAWQSFGLIDIILALAVAAGLGLAAWRASGAGAPVPLGTIAAVLGALATVLILFRIISPPDLIDAFSGDTNIPEGVDVETDVGRELWSFVGLIAAAGIAYGGWRAMQEEPQAAPAPPPPQATPPPPPSPPPASGTGAPPPGPTV